MYTFVHTFEYNKKCKLWIHVKNFKFLLTKLLCTFRDYEFVKVKVLSVLSDPGVIILFGPGVIRIVWSRCYQYCLVQVLSVLFDSGVIRIVRPRCYQYCLVHVLSVLFGPCVTSIVWSRCYQNCWVHVSSVLFGPGVISCFVQVLS